ncbi:vitamin K-dependent gamma-carboxylase-like protein [Stackebrandtia albiflava]|uniref:Vitamin K-dependent gamma-carboxylase-like protein n=1 Tax=Stackebrandtia albiflava TaxID=406432 RepID=A0A562UPI7_9ACTN|nr:hypothetical protein [Stackebrandtia albiflava]TWJ07527.1 vitamin K-dependent gamma-carboxylase-like protein [Stackebrandtia albiflava]
MVTATAPRRGIGRRLLHWATAPVPYGRIAAFRTLLYLYILADITMFTHWVYGHAGAPGNLYMPLYIADFLHLPVPTPGLVHGLFWAMVVLAPIAATGWNPKIGRWRPQIFGFLVFLLFTEWMIIAMSYGKVDHDRFGFLIALAVVPFVGRARQGDPTLSESGGWALRTTQLAVVATYFLAALAKLRYGGFAWLTGSTMTRAVMRRGTIAATWMLKVPGMLVLAQFGILLFELFSPVVFVVSQRLRYWIVAFFYSFHLVVFLTVTIAFVPHLIAMAAFLPLEKPVQAIMRALGKDPHTVATGRPPQQPDTRPVTA